jgi:hypothetical protein
MKNSDIKCIFFSNEYILFKQLIEEKIGIELNNIIADDDTKLIEHKYKIKAFKEIINYIETHKDKNDYVSD